ncbi:MAG: tRNA (guanosine(37)-N1)-methyltransferase TrmD, partial [Nitrospirota bacterium]
MKCDIITIFPEIIEIYTGYGILRKALQKGIIEVRAHDLRSYTRNRHKTVDDYPYGGGAGMVMKPEPFFT